MAKSGQEEGPQPEEGYFIPRDERSLTQADTQPTKAVKPEREPTPEPEKQPVASKKPSFFKQAIFFIGLVFLTYLYWFFGQLTLGIPDEYIATIFTVLLYNWFVKNNYELPKWLKK